MSVENGIIKEPISVKDPYYCMGIGSYNGGFDVGYICISDKINIWSLNKPNRIVSDLIMREDEQYNSAALLIPRFAPNDINYLGVLNEALWKYPTANSATWYRLTDFIGYYHYATPPILGIDITPSAGENITIGDIIKFKYRLSGVHPRSVNFGLNVLKNRYLAAIVTGEKATGTTESGEKFTWNYNSEFRQITIAERPFYNSTVGGVYEDFTINVEIGQNYIIKPGITISCLLCLLDSKDINSAWATSMLLPANDPSDIFICDNVFQFKIVG